MTSMIEQATWVGDAVLYEGYLLYPYRASAAKNQLRWQFGVLVPPSYASDERGEHSWSRSECLLEPGKRTTLHVRLRFLHAQRRQVLRTGDGGERPVASATVGDAEYTTWDEALKREIDVVLPLAELLVAPVTTPFDVAGGEETEQVSDTVRLVRSRQPLTGELRARLHSLTGPYGGTRLRVELHNTTPWTADAPTRQEALRHSLLAAHLVLAVDTGHFLSLLDPPEWAKPAAEACENTRTWPALIGAQDRSQVVLSSPIVLYDNPAIAEESQGELFDGTEIDEILTLRTMALTDEEKREARGTDPKARELMDRVDHLPPELLDRMHGTIRYLRSVTGEQDREPVDITARPDVPWWDPGADASVSPETDSVIVAGVPVAAGSTVRLRPGLRRADAQDMFLTGRTATVRTVLSDVDDEPYVAVTLDEDPGAEINHSHGRYRYFSPDEIEPVPAESQHS